MKGVSDSSDEVVHAARSRPRTDATVRRVVMSNSPAKVRAILSLERALSSIEDGPAGPIPARERNTGELRPIPQQKNPADPFGTAG